MRRAAACPRSTATSSTGVSASAPSIAHARARGCGARIAAGGQRRRDHDAERRGATSGAAAVSTSIRSRSGSAARAAEDVGDVARELLDLRPACGEPRAPLAAARRGSRCPCRRARARAPGSSCGSGSPGRLGLVSARLVSTAASAARTFSERSDSSSTVKPGASPRRSAGRSRPRRRSAAARPRRSAAGAPAAAACRTGRRRSAAAAAGAGRGRRRPRGAACPRRTSPAGRRRRRSGAAGRASSVGTHCSGAGEQHAAALLRQAAARRGQRQVGRHVVGDAAGGRGTRAAARSGRRSRPAARGEQPRVAGRPAVHERVGQAVAVVVELVAAEPRDRREHDEDRRRLGVLDGERHRRAVARPRRTSSTYTPDGPPAPAR